MIMHTDEGPTMLLEAQTQQDMAVLAAFSQLVRQTEQVHVYTEGTTVICATTTRTDGQVMVGPNGEPPKFMIIGF